jgi:hypothetical protein
VNPKRLGGPRRVHENLADAKSRIDVKESENAPCGHLALFVGQDTLKNIWPGIARWLSSRLKWAWFRVKISRAVLLLTPIRGAL